jgi:hypothetical protein
VDTGFLVYNERTTRCFAWTVRECHRAAGSLRTAIVEANHTATKWCVD